MRVSIFIIVFMLPLFSFVQAYACSCARGDIWISDYLSEEYLLIFEGTPLSTKPSARMMELEKALLGPLSHKYIDEIVQTYARKGVFSDASHVSEFSVSKAYRGVVPARVVVKHHVQGPACGIRPELNKTIMVVANKSKNGTFSTSSCTLYRAPEATIRKYFETGEDILLPERGACYRDIKTAFAKTEKLSEMKLNNVACRIYQKDIVSRLKRQATKVVK